MTTDEWLIFRNFLILFGVPTLIATAITALDWLADRRDRRTHDRAA